MSSDNKTHNLNSKLGDLLELVIDYRGKTPKKLGGDFSESGVPVISAIHIKRGKIVWNERERFVTKEMFQKWMKDPLKKGDVLLTSEAPLGEVALVPSDDDLVLSQRLFALRTKPELLNSKYLMYFFQSSLGQAQLQGRSSGSTVVGIRQSELMNIIIPCPPIEEQRIVGEVLANIDAKISANEGLSKTLEEIAQAIFKSWFIDFDPVKAKMKGEKPTGMNYATIKLFPDSMEESERDFLPKGWHVKKLGELITPKRGKTITKATCVQGEVPVVAGGLQPAYFHNTANASQPVITVSASGANAGFVRLYFKDIWASDCSYINSEITEHVHFWYLVLSRNQELIYGMQQGAAQPHIYPSDLMRLKICYPNSMDLLVKFEETIAPFFNEMGALERENETLRSLRESLLPRLISGELQIPAEMLTA